MSFKELKITPVTGLLILVNVLAYGAQMLTQNKLANTGLLYGPAVAHGQWWRLVTSAFLHGGLIHIGFNMYLLFVLGPQLEEALGKLRFVLIYLAALFGGTAAVMLFDWQQPTLGASGAVLGLASTLWILLFLQGVAHRQNQVFGLVALNVVLPLLLPGISFWGHFGGVLCGALTGFIIGWLPRKVRMDDRLGLMLLGGLVVILALLSMFAARLPL